MSIRPEYMYDAATLPNILFQFCTYSARFYAIKLNIMLHSYHMLWQKMCTSFLFYYAHAPLLKILIKL